MNKKAKISAIERDERSIALPIRIPLAKALVGLKSSILEAIASGDFSLIETFCQEKLLPLLEVQSELAYLKGGRRAELSARKVVNESVVEFAPVKLSLGDDGDERARGVIEYLRRISGLDPSKAKTKFNRHIAGAIGDLSKEITSEVKKAVEDLTLKNVHLRGGKAKILQTLLENGVQVTNTPALAETLFRTQSQQAYAAGRWNTSMDSDIGDYIWGFEYVTAGDDRVREGHRVLEGVRLPKEDPFWKKYFPPNGWNCRCTTLEIWKDEPTAKIDFGITGRDPRKRTSDAMNVPKEFRGNVGIFATAKPKKKRISYNIYQQIIRAVNRANRTECDSEKHIVISVTPILGKIFSQDSHKYGFIVKDETNQKIYGYIYITEDEKYEFVNDQGKMELFENVEILIKKATQYIKENKFGGNADLHWKWYNHNSLTTSRMSPEAKKQLDGYRKFFHFVEVNDQMTNLCDAREPERQVIKKFKDLGYQVFKISQKKHFSHKIPDIRINEVYIEIKSPNSDRIRTISNIIRGGLDQFADLIIVNVVKFNINEEIIKKIMKEVLREHGNVISVDIEFWISFEEKFVIKKGDYGNGTKAILPLRTSIN